MTRAGRASTSPHPLLSGSMPEGSGSKVAADRGQPARARPITATAAVPAAPTMGRVSNVELMHTGTWDLSTGTTTFTVEDLAAAVTALDCPAVRRPILKLGHTPDPTPGQPAVGFVANMATAESGRTLVGDYVGMPGWLVDQDENGVSVLASTYPDRSIEGWYDFRCQLGHAHPFVVTAVALLGTEAPAIGTIQSLQDLAGLYGVAATTDDTAHGRAVVAYSNRGAVMSNPIALQVAASVTVEDVRRAFYASTLGDKWAVWVEEIQLEPLQLIVLDDETSTRSRVPVVLGDGDGQDAVSFGEPIPVVVRYDDVPATTAAAAAAVASAGRSVRYTSRDGTTPPAGRQPAAAQASAAGQPSAAPRRPTPGMTAATMTVDAAAWHEREALLAHLQAEATRRVHAERDQVLAKAIRDGKLPPARRQHWAQMWDADPEGARQAIASLPDNLVPVRPIGHNDDGVEREQEHDEFAHLFGPKR